MTVMGDGSYVREARGERGKRLCWKSSKARITFQTTRISYQTRTFFIVQLSASAKKAFTRKAALDWKPLVSPGCDGGLPSELGALPLGGVEVALREGGGQLLCDTGGAPAPGGGQPRRDLTSWNTNPWSPETPAMELAGAGASSPPWPSSWTVIRPAPGLDPDPCRPCRTDTRRVEGFFRSAFLECKPRWKRLLCQAEQRCPSKSCSLCTVKNVGLLKMCSCSFNNLVQSKNLP